jgi:hypothetical protein
MVRTMLGFVRSPIEQSYTGLGMIFRAESFDDAQTDVFTYVQFWRHPFTLTEESKVKASGLASNV